MTALMLITVLIVLAIDLAMFLRGALAPRGHHYDHGESGGRGVLTIEALELRHPDGEHYRNKATGEFASAEDEAADPDAFEHEAGDIGRKAEPTAAQDDAADPA